MWHLVWRLKESRLQGGLWKVMIKHFLWCSIQLVFNLMPVWGLIGFAVEIGEIAIPLSNP